MFLKELLYFRFPSLFDCLCERFELTRIKCAGDEPSPMREFAAEIVLIESSKLSIFVGKFLYELPCTLRRSNYAFKVTNLICYAIHQHHNWSASYFPKIDYSTDRLFLFQESIICRIVSKKYKMIKIY